MCSASFHSSLLALLEYIVTTQHIPENVQCIFYHQHISFVVALQMGYQDRCRVALVVSGGPGSSSGFIICSVLDFLTLWALSKLPTH